MNAFGDAKSSTTWRIDAAGLVACGVLTFAAYLAGAEPLIDRRSQAMERVQQLCEERQKHQDLLASNRDLRTKLGNVQQTLAKADVPLQPARTVNQRIAALTALANEVGLEVQSINTSAAIPGTRFGQVPIRLNSTGGYRTSADFLHRLRETFKDMGVTGIDLSDNPADPKAAIFNVQLVWYVQPASTSK